jgi:hypothetical protein
MEIIKHLLNKDVKLLMQVDFKCTYRFCMQYCLLLTTIHLTAVRHLLLYRKNNVDEIYIRENHALRCLT